MAHAILSPSSAARWMACTPSARLEMTFEDTTSEAAEEGTLAHELGELLIKTEIGQCDVSTFKNMHYQLSRSKYYSNEMLDYCMAYRDFVLKKYHDARSHTPDAELILEAKLDLSSFIPESYGTADAQIIADGKLQIVDLKYGRGVFVEAEDNPQLMIYATGALISAQMFYNIDTVEMSIFQPRINNIKTVEMDADRLLAWAANRVTPLAKIAFEGKGEFKVGDHCFFCKAKMLCKAYANKQMEMANTDFEEPHLLTDGEIAYVIKHADDFISWAQGVKKYALEQAVNNGKQWDGFKLVEGRSNRRYKSQDDVLKRLVENGVSMDIIYDEPKLLGITKLERALTKKVFNEMLSDLIIKPQGKPTLVPIDDSRTAINSIEYAAEDFEV